ncbi:unnamed protein product [Prorocentrum cordatum]|uniref:Uncharacterized protein n=1 Tax=Prorocentrum cordatum TaxID=2364126 RepID=A0ABN9U6G7_9DINO|nr:unnamed protein product [Polarella glacialis]
MAAARCPVTGKWAGDVSRPPGSLPEWAASAKQRGAGYLRAQSAPATTQTRYQDAYEKLMGFASEHGLSVLAGAAVDASLEVHLDHQWLDGRGIYDARVAVRGTAHVQCSNLKDPTALQLARAALRGWQQRVGGVSRDPMPQQALFLACDWLCDTGDKADLSAAQALMTQFHGYLRPGEVRPITAIDIMVAGEQDDTAVFGDDASKKAGRDQAAGLLAKLKAAKRGSSVPLSGLTLAEYERRCKAAFEACSLRALRLIPHMDRIQSRGHWEARKSALRYMKQGRLMRQIGKLTPAYLQKYKSVSTSVCRKLLRF